MVCTCSWQEVVMSTQKSCRPFAFWNLSFVYRRHYCCRLQSLQACSTFIWHIPNVLQRLCSRLGSSARCPTKGISWWSKWLIYCQELVKQKLRLSLTKTRRLLVVQLLCGAIFTLGCTLTQAEVCSVLRHNRWMKLLECACFKWVSSFTGVWSDPMQLVYAGCFIIHGNIYIYIYI